MLKLIKTSPIINRIKTSPILNQPRQLSFSFRSLVSREPVLWVLHQPYIRWDQMKQKARGIDPKERVIRSDTEIVIDGFQGSANGFAADAFRQCQTRDVKVAHHMHSPAQIIQAIKQDIPVLLTIREPVGAIFSLTTRWRHISKTQALQSYIGFYAKLRPFASRCVVSSFEQTTQNLGYIVQRVNARFATHFDVIEVAKVNAHHLKTKAKREALKQEQMKELATERNAHLLVKARELYQALEAFAE